MLNLNHPAIKKKRELEVCFSPAMLPYYKPEEKIVVVIDIFRASSAICTGIAHGIKEIIPVKSLETAHEYQDKGYIVAAERNGEIVNGFDFGNSPFAFMDEKLKGKSIVMSTSNCTTAIVEAKGAKSIVIGSFINFSALADYLKHAEEDVILLCSGWKKRFNLEDSIFAGALVERLEDYFEIECDAATAALQLYHSSKADLREFLRSSSHSRRLSHLHIEKDIDYCLVADQSDVIPHFNGNSITKMSEIEAKKRKSA